MKVSKGFKQTEIGEIPEDWGVNSLKNICTYRRGSFPQPYGLPIWYDDTNGAPFVQVYDIDNNWKIKPQTKRYISKAAQDLSVYAPKGTVVLTIQGSIGRIAITQYDAFIDRTLLIFESFMVLFDKKYFCLAIETLFEKEKRNAPGGIIKTITKEALSSFEIPLPPLKEQQAIAEVLSDMDRMISQTEALIEKKKAIKQGMMQELLRPKDGWVTKKLGIIATFHKGKGLPKSKINEFGRFKCIHYGELFTKYKENINNILSYTDENDNCCYSQINDVLMPTSDVTPNGLATASCVNEDGVILGGDILVIRLMPNILDGTFLAYFISQNKEIIMKLVTGSTVYHIYGSDLKDFEVSFPDISTQIEIIRAISDLETYVSFLELKNEKLKLQKQGMMQALLTGRIRLT
jgi:type I restriction enzyme S subunit